MAIFAPPGHCGLPKSFLVPTLRSVHDSLWRVRPVAHQITGTILIFVSTHASLTRSVQERLRSRVNMY